MVVPALQGFVALLFGLLAVFWPALTLPFRLAGHTKMQFPFPPNACSLKALEEETPVFWANHRQRSRYQAMRCFRFRISSMLDAAGRRKSERRFAHVWVNEKELDKAEGMARAVLAREGCAIEGVELSLAPTPEEIARLDPAQSAARERAQTEGVCAYFSSYDAYGD
jgi:hypothetical protein